MEASSTFAIFLLGLSRISNAVDCQHRQMLLSYRASSMDNSYRRCLTCVTFTLTNRYVDECICEPIYFYTTSSTFFDENYNSFNCREALRIKNINFKSSGLTSLNGKWSDLELFDISENRIDDLAPDFFNSLINLKILNVSENSLTTLNNDLLAPLSMLQNLDLSRNHINGLDEPFKSLIDLFEINLGYNNIIKISAKTFRHQEHLEVLLLNNNKIISFEASFSLKPVSNALVSLDLSWNEIRNLTLTGNIQRLDISHNNLTEISIKLSSSLNFLNASHNKIVKIGDSALLEAVKLMTIDLSFNYLQSFPTSSFKDQKFLQHIDISNNLFSKNKYGPQNNWASFFLHCTQLQSVALDNNLWTCSDLKDILHNLNSHSVSIKHGEEHTSNNILGIKCIELNNDTNTSIDLSDISSRIAAQVQEELWEKIENYMTKSLNNISSRVSNLENNMVDNLIEKIGNIEKQLSTDHVEKNNASTYDSSKNALQAVVLNELSSKIKDLESDKIGKEKLFKKDLNTIEQLLQSVNDHSISGTVIQTLLLLLVVCILLYFLYVVLKKSKIVTRESLNLV